MLGLGIGTADNPMHVSECYFHPIDIIASKPGLCHVNGNGYIAAARGLCRFMLIESNTPVKLEQKTAIEGFIEESVVQGQELPTKRKKFATLFQYSRGFIAVEFDMREVASRREVGELGKLVSKSIDRLITLIGEKVLSYIGSQVTYKGGIGEYKTVKDAFCATFTQGVVRWTAELVGVPVNNEFVGRFVTQSFKTSK